ncbi:hypothetical protein FA95DRAFT_1290104 [Auriscalpium vulgare]|uniref:Uncharacterized protein n=1 Tax=Auriscalpium vulgare TaxID=40419 RepID=A0ACB8R2M4_9AGAM|nr:hypothetical protein FA95DRAFT_1290104 [Auriscalpium vulgare]
MPCPQDCMHRYVVRSNFRESFSPFTSSQSNVIALREQPNSPSMSKAYSHLDRDAYALHYQLRAAGSPVSHCNSTLPGYKHDIGGVRATLFPICVRMTSRRCACFIWSVVRNFILIVHSLSSTSVRLAKFVRKLFASPEETLALTPTRIVSSIIVAFPSLNSNRYMTDCGASRKCTMQ